MCGSVVRTPIGAASIIFRGIGIVIRGVGIGATRDGRTPIARAIKVQFNGTEVEVREDVGDADLPNPGQVRTSRIEQHIGGEHEIARIIKVPLIKGGKNGWTRAVKVSELRKGIWVNIPQTVSLNIGSFSVEVENEALLRRQRESRHSAGDLRQLTNVQICPQDQGVARVQRTNDAALHLEFVDACFNADGRPFNHGLCRADERKQCNADEG